VANNDLGAFYWTDSAYPKLSWDAIAFVVGPAYPDTNYRLGVPAPAAAPTVVVSGTPDENEESFDMAYVYTYVTADGREGPPSDPSAIDYDVTDNQTQSLSGLSVLTGSHPTGAGSVKRIYRSNAGTNNAAFQYVGEVPMATTTFVDTLTADLLQEVIPSSDWTGPPDDDSATHPDGPLQGLCNMGSGIMAGFVKNTVWFSEPYLPHAWNVNNTITIPHEIVAITPTLKGLVVGTTGVPYLMQGSDPSAILDVPLNSKQSCVSAKSMVSMDGYALYASPDGLVLVDGTEVILATRGTHDRDDWQAISPETIRAFYWERRYVAFYEITPGVTFGGFIFDPAGGKNLYTTHDQWYENGWSDLEDDTLYLLEDATTPEIHAFNPSGGANLTWQWWSKAYEVPAQTSMSCFQVASDGAVTITVSGDGTDVMTDRVIPYGTAAEQYAARDAHRMPAATSIYQTVRIEISGSEKCDYFKLATSVEELVSD
jgi:hypothetical protein